MSTGLRIISLAPTQTEILGALGLTDELIGVTDDCDYPAEIKEKSRFGSWYSPNLQATVDANPDLVCTFGAHQEDVRETLIEAGLEVYHSDPPTVEAALRTLGEIASLTNSERTAECLLADLNRRLESVETHLAPLESSQRLRVLRIMNWDPLITVGPGSFQYDVIRMAGGCNVTSDGRAPYFACDSADIIMKDPEAVFFCEPEIQRLLGEDPAWRRTSAYRNGRIFVFQCGLTCRSGPRIVEMVESLARALYPHLPL